MFEVLYRLRPYILLFCLLAMSVVVMVNANRPLMRGVRAQTLKFVGAVEYQLSWASEIILALNENQQLRSSNLRLTSELARLRIAAFENEELRSALGWQNVNDYEALPARIIAREPYGTTNYLTIDVGSEQGVTTDMAVISHEGIIGRTVHVSSSYSEVMPYLHSQFHVPVMIDSLRSVGIVSGSGSTPDSLALENVVRTEDVQIGQRVITHQASEIFPPNIPVGTIEAVHSRPGNNFLLIKVEPAAALHTTHFVFVIVSQPVHLSSTSESAPAN